MNFDQWQIVLSLVSSVCAVIYATANEAVAYMIYRCFLFFLFFSRPQKNMRQPFSGTAERIFMKLLRVCNVVPPPGESIAAAWQMANVDDLLNLRYDSGAITRGHHARRLHYKIMSA